MIPTLIVPTLHQYGRLAEMIASVDYPIGHAIVIDNGGQCPDLTNDLIDRITILRLPDNLGVASSWNLGIQLSPHSERWVIVNDDVRFLPGGLERLSEMDPTGVVLDFAKHPQWSCFALGDDVVNVVGLFDPFYWPGMGEDVNYGKRVREAGLRFRCLKDWYDDSDPASTRSTMREYDEWGFRHIGIGTASVVEGYSLRYRRDMEAYLNGGPDIHPTSEYLVPDVTGVTR